MSCTIDSKIGLYICGLFPGGTEWTVIEELLFILKPFGITTTVLSGYMLPLALSAHSFINIDGKVTVKMTVTVTVKIQNRSRQLFSLT